MTSAEAGDRPKRASLSARIARTAAVTAVSRRRAAARGREVAICCRTCGVPKTDHRFAGLRVRLRLWSCVWHHRGPMTLRMLCLTFARLARWITLLARSSVSKDAEQLVLR